MNYQEIMQVLLDSGQTNSDIGHGDIASTNGIGPYINVFSSGGEGKGENWERVWHFTDHNVFISMQGHYTSYDGVDFSGHEPREVFPKEKTITVYE